MNDPFVDLKSLCGGDDFGIGVGYHGESHLRPFFGGLGGGSHLEA